MIHCPLYACPYFHMHSLHTITRDVAQSILHVYTLTPVHILCTDVILHIILNFECIQYAYVYIYVNALDV